MSRFENVSIDKTANIYFDGKVTSRSVTFADGTKKTLGIALPGEYTFNTAEKERMEIQKGELDVLLPGSQTWQRVTGGESFEVPAKSSFQMRVETVTDYCCHFLP